MTAREHKRLLGIFFYIYFGLQLFGMLIGIIGGLFFFGVAASNLRANQEFPIAFFTIIMIVVLAISFLMLIPIVLAANKISNDKPNAKVWGIIASIIAILNVPLGTALGVYGLWFLLGDYGKELYDNDGMMINNSPPPPNSWQ